MSKHYSFKHFSILPIINLVAILSAFIGLTMVFSLFVALAYGEGDAWAIGKSMIISLSFGAILWGVSRHDYEMNSRQGFLSVTLSWIVASAFGALPLYFATDFSYTDSFFEAMSGFTTTGASVISDIEALPHGILFWRSFTHWLGGMGIIVFTVTIMPLLGKSGTLLFAAEAPGPVSDKLTPKISETATLLYLVYAGISFAEYLLLWLGPMDWFDAACHTFGTMATGGFSTKNTSVAYFNSPYVDWVIIVFMILAGTNFVLHYAGLHGKVLKYFKDREWRFWMFVLLGSTLFIYGNLLTDHFYDQSTKVISDLKENPFRQIVFQVVSIVTTTGFATADYEGWSIYSQMLIFMLMFVGGMAGSTAGGIKAIRVLLFMKMAFVELRRMIHPHGYLPVKLGTEIVDEGAIKNTIAFLLFYVLVMGVTTLTFTFYGHDIVTSMTATVSMLSNVGPGLGDIGPTNNFAFFADSEKWIMSFVMLMGRLEILTVIVIFNRHFWRF
jgi:trk system potassium uptake protein